MINYILIFLGGMCLFFSGLMLVFKFTSIITKKEMVKLELTTGVMLLLNALQHKYNGVPGMMAYWIMIVSSFGVALSVSLETVGFNAYLVSQLMGKRKIIDRIPGKFHAGFAISGVSVFLVLLSQFTGVMYRIDEGGHYIRGPLIFLDYALIAAFALLMFSVLYQYRKVWKRGKVMVWTAFIVLPMLGGMIQLFYPDSELLCVGFGLSAVLMYVTTLLEQNNYLMKAYYTEAATGLLNSYGYLSEVEKRIASRDICDYDAFYLDIKNMTRVNQMYGNDVGNQIIRDFGWYLQEHVKKDEVVGRLGGNYFVALVRKKHTEAFLNMIEAVPVEIEAAGGKKTVQISAVAGVFSINDPDMTADQILGQATVAVKIAKHTLNQSYVFLTPQLKEEYDAAEQLKQEIKNGLDRGEFVPFYQPKVYAGSQELSGAEMLVRWRHDGKMIPPGMFIPIMEKDGSICSLDFYMLEHLCRDMKKWLEEGLKPPKISVNFSRKNLGNPELAKQIYQTIKNFGIPVHLIEIEITETIDEFSFDSMKKVVDELHVYGISVAIDDFGTGSSSIQLLSDMNFDVLKIDKSFIDSMTETRRKLLKYIIGMAKLFHARIVAEGVEQQEQLHVLQGMGCDEIQGYLFDRPLPKEEFENRMQHGMRANV